MEKLLLFIFATSGLSWIVVRGKLFKSFREWLTTCYINSMKRMEAGKLFAKVWYKILWFFNECLNCDLCFGVWSGAINYVLIYKKIDIEILAYGFAGSVISMLIVSLNKFLSRG